MTYITDLKDKITDLEQQNAELRDAATEALEYLDKRTGHLVIDCKDSLRLALYGALRRDSQGESHE